MTPSSQYLLLPLLSALSIAACSAEIGEGGLTDVTLAEGTLASVRPGAIQAFGRGVVLPGLADPDAFISESGQAYISGTYDGRVLPIWRLDNSVFTEFVRYSPSIDPNYDYCNVWAPDLTKTNEIWLLSFAAARVAKGAGCGQVGQQQIFYAVAPDENLVFGTPAVPDFGPNAPRSTPVDGCPSDGCDKALRIDPSVFTDVDGRAYLSYTWFERGNHNSTFALDDPTNIIRNTSPVNADEENVNEAPEIFRRGDTYYFLYSAGDFRGNYRLHYIMADSVQELTKARGTYQLTIPVHRRDGRKYETAGHGSVVEFAGSFFAVYHVSDMNENGDIIGRDTVVSPIHFKPDGTMRLLNALDLSWTYLPGQQYSIDVKTNGNWIGPCVDAGILNGANRYRLTDLCPFNDQLAPLETIESIRVCHTAGDWNQAQCSEQPFTAEADRLFIPL